MPLRVVCPSCSTALAVKDEHANRPVKCPKCGGVIPAPQSPPPAAPPKPAVEERDEPERRPSRAADALDDLDEDRPRRPRRDDRDDRDDRPARRRRRDDEDDRPARDRRPPGGKSNVPLILGIVGFFMLTCCGGVGYGVYWVIIINPRNAFQRLEDDRVKRNTSVNATNYDVLEVGVTTRSHADALIGNFRGITSRPATNEDLDRLFPSINDRERKGIWSQKVAQNRVLIWQNEDDYILAAFHPNTEADARLQMKEWRPANKANPPDGEPSDALFLAKYPPAEKPKESKPKESKPKENKLPDTTPELTTTQLVREFARDQAAANAKYRGKTLIVRGTLYSRSRIFEQLSLTLTDGSELKGVGGLVEVGSENGAGNALRGQTVRLKGRCEQGDGQLVALSDCEVLEVVPAKFVVVTADTLLADFTRDLNVAGQKYAGQAMDAYAYLHVTDARVAQVGKNEVYLTGPTTKGAKIRLLANYRDEDAKPFAALKVGDKVSVKGQSYFSGAFGDIHELVIDWATIAP